MKKKEITNADLAKSIEGVRQSLTKEIHTAIEGLAIATAKGFERHEKILNTMNLRIDNIEDDIHDIKTTVSPIFRMSGMQDKEISDLKHRVSRLEAKASK